MAEPSASHLPADRLALAASHLAKGRANDALEAAAHALLARDDPDARALFVKCVRAADRLPAVPGFRRLMVRALREAWDRPVALTGPAIALITNEPAVAAGIRAAMWAWPRGLSARECGAAIDVLAADELLRALLDTALVNDGGLERLLTSVRAVLFDVAVHAKGKAAREMTNLGASLARQCFNNEYVFDVTEAEHQSLAWLRTAARAALAERAAVPASQLIALAAYAPLHTLERDRELTGRSWLKPLEALITEQVREPGIEATLRASMPRLTEIADPVSKKVREQYEDNPYPRWIAVAPTAPENGILAHLHGVLPEATLRAVAEPDAAEILVAGCGTGQQPIDTVQRFPKARVLAIDLSLASLAYAKRKSDAAGLGIEYGQADILEFAPDRRFDLIESSGVLHHLAEPMRGWAALVKLLKPGGFMRLGLYSELGRSTIVALQQIVAERGYGATANDIRRCRQDLISGQDARFAAILHSPEFCSTSACRDLLFHVQERRLTLPQIEAFLAEHGLSLLGFELDAATLGAYRRAFPSDATMTDLASWHRFETANPDTFRAMYRFWVQAP
jgi:2-polyprenyl-3-methyl-5-hydroxy-6-metoxy-1,4-benzoquinol methylase